MHRLCGRSSQLPDLRDAPRSWRLCAAKVILRNFEGVITSYTQPEHYVQDCHCDVCTGKKKVEKTGVAWVAEGTKQRYLEPTKLLRNERHVKK